LRAFKPIKQVSSQRAIKVNLQSRYNCRKDELVFFEAIFARLRHHNGSSNAHNTYCDGGAEVM
jgi:hypothetical protein